MLIASGIALVGASIGLPWFEAETTFAAHGTTPASHEKSAFYFDHEVLTAVHSQVISLVDDFAILMHQIALIVAFMLLTALASLAFILLDRRGLAVMFGWFSTGLGLLALGAYAVWWSHDIGFIGSSTSGGVTGSYSISFHPSTGYLALATATVLFGVVDAKSSRIYLRTTKEEDKKRKEEREAKNDPWGGMPEDEIPKSDRAEDK